MSLDIYGPSLTVQVLLHGDDRQHGFIFHLDLRAPTIQDYEHNTLANDIERWRSRFCNATIRAINGETIDSIVQFQQQIKTLRDKEAPDCSITIAHEGFGNLHTAQSLPQMHFD